MNLLIWGTLLIGTLGNMALGVEIGDFLRNPDGSVRTDINQYEAVRACTRLAMRLPTARELAEESTKYGAKIFEIDVPGTPNAFLVKAKNSDGREDKFYYGTLEYERPSGDLGKYWSWSSSSPRNWDDFAFVFYGHDGDLDDYRRDYKNNYISVRCVRED